MNDTPMLPFETPDVSKNIICGNCDVVMQNLIDSGEKFDLILTDPPYNVGKDFGNDTDKVSAAEFIRQTYSRCFKYRDLLTDKGSIIIFASHLYVFAVHDLLREASLNYRRMNIWLYNNGMSRQTREPVTTYEPFLWFSKSDSEWTYNVDDVRVPYKSTERLKTPCFKKNKKGEKVAWTPNPLGAKRSDVWECPVLSGKLYANERTEHPTQKPEKLITELIKAFCPKNEKGQYCGRILDPFHGSGTLGVCCEKLNKLGHCIQWVGIELEKKWCDVANERLSRII